MCVCSSLIWNSGRYTHWPRYCRTPPLKAGGKRMTCSRLKMKPSRHTNMWAHVYQKYSKMTHFFTQIRQHQELKSEALSMLQCFSHILTHSSRMQWIKHADSRRSKEFHSKVLIRLGYRHALHRTVRSFKEVSLKSFQGWFSLKGMAMGSGYVSASARWSQHWCAL